jgi:tetratricopeptide (TPR) repeat protein
MRIQLYAKILRIDKSQPVARERLAQLHQERRARELQEKARLAGAHERRGDWLAAIEIYQELIRENPEVAGWSKLLAAAFQSHVASMVALAESHEMNEDWERAAVIYSYLIDRYPGGGDWAPRLKRVNEQEQVAATYQKALNVLQSGDRMTAVKLLVEVINEQPYFKDSARLLLFAVKGVDVQELQQRLKELERMVSGVWELEERIQQLQKYEKLYHEDAPAALRTFIDYIGKNYPNSFIPCPDCGIRLSATNLLQHFIETHRKIENE